MFEYKCGRGLEEKPKYKNFALLTLLVRSTGTTYIYVVYSYVAFYNTLCFIHVCVLFYYQSAAAHGQTAK